MNTKKRIACALLLCAAGIGMAGLQCSLAIRRYTVQSGKVAAGRQLRIVMLSDLHSDMTEIVGRGLLLDWKPRLFNPPEIVVVDIESQREEG